MIQEICIALVGVGLVIASYTDICKRKIWLPPLLAETPILLILNCIFGHSGVSLWIASMGCFALFYVISVVTGGQLGKGDAVLFGMTGAGIGLANNLLLIYLTFLIAFIAAVFQVVVRRADRKKQMPLAPMALGAFVVIEVIGYGKV